MDDFEHLEHEQDGIASHYTAHMEKVMERLNDDHGEVKDMINFSSDFSTNEPEDPKKATSLLLESEKGRPVEESLKNLEVRSPEPAADLFTGTVGIPDLAEVLKAEPVSKKEQEKQEIIEKDEFREMKMPDHETDVVSCPAKKPDDSWNIIETSNPVPEPISKVEKKEESVSDHIVADTKKTGRISEPESGESEFESEVEASPAKSFKSVKQEVRRDQVEEVEIAPKEIFSSMGIGE